MMIGRLLFVLTLIWIAYILVNAFKPFIKSKTRTSSPPPNNNRSGFNGSNPIEVDYEEVDSKIKKD